MQSEYRDLFTAFSADETVNMKNTEQVKKYIKEIDYKYNNTRYIFNEPYQLMIEKKKGKDIPFWYCIEDEELGIDIMEESVSAAEESFHSEIDFLWRCYAVESDEKLAHDAVLLKIKVNKLIREAIKL